MSLSNQAKINRINDIYQEFLHKVREIESARDRKIAALLASDDEEKIARIRQDLKSRFKG